MTDINQQVLHSVCVSKILEQESGHQINTPTLTRAIKDVTSKVKDFAQCVDEIVALYFAYSTGVRIKNPLIVDWSRKW